MLGRAIYSDAGSVNSGNSKQMQYKRYIYESNFTF